MQHYASATAIDGAWRTLQAALDKADHLDGVIDAHNQYLASMVCKLFVVYFCHELQSLCCVGCVCMRVDDQFAADQTNVADTTTH